MKRIAKYSLIAAALGLLCSCQQEENIAQAVLGSVSSLSFAAQNAESQVVRIVSDAPWKLETPDWVTVDPSSGSGDMEVTISVTDNYTGGEMDEPREAVLIFGGNMLSSRFELRVKQEGNAYKNAVRVTVSGLGDLEEGKALVLENATVMALSSGGAIVSDGTVNAYVAGLSETPGSVVELRGFAAKVNGMPAVTLDEASVKSAGEASLPAAQDVTETISAYPASAIDYVSVTGIVTAAVGGGFDVLVTEGERTYSAFIYEAPASMSVATLNGHNVKVDGYTLGRKGELAFNLIPVVIEDLGVESVILFQDDFSWLAPFVAASKAGDSVGKSTADNAPNVYTADGLGAAFLPTVQEHGYVDLFPSAMVIYLQDCYLKFSKNKNIGGIQLPPIDFQGASDIELSFDWSVHVGGGGPDDVKMVVEIEGEGQFENGTKVSAPMEHTMKKEGWADGDQKWSWKTETVKISGVNNDTRIKIHPPTFAGVETSGYYRWYLDNILVVPGEGFTPTPPEAATVFPVVWSFKEPGDDWVSGTDFQILGGTGTGSWVLSDTHEGKLVLNRAGDGAVTPTYKNEGEIGVRILSTGVYLNDYWLFEVDHVDNPAGTYGISYFAGSSAAGPKFFVVEYSTDEGASWTAVNTKTTSEKMTDSAGTTRDVTYTYGLSYTSNVANELLEVKENFHLPALKGKLQIRARVNDTMVLGRNKELNGANNGGTTRVGRHAEITFLSD